MGRRASTSVLDSKHSIMGSADIHRKPQESEKVFANQERVSGLPEKGADLRGSPGNFRGSPGNFRGSPGNFRGSPGIAAKFHSERTSGEVAEKLPGKFGELPGTSQKLGVA